MFIICCQDIYKHLAPTTQQKAMLKKYYLESRLWLAPWPKLIGVIGQKEPSNINTFINSHFKQPCIFFSAGVIDYPSKPRRSLIISWNSGLIFSSSFHKNIYHIWYFICRYPAGHLLLKQLCNYTHFFIYKVNISIYSRSW